jgi:protein-S-isoprenylcysteine O-methyltransferase Ste14
MDLTPYVICVYLWSAWWLSWLALAFGSKRTRRRETPASRISYTLVAWLGLWLMFFARHLGSSLLAAIFPHRTWTGWMGVAITLSGFGITYWARAILGRNWSANVTIKEGHDLIRTGPYRFIRHPIYTGLILAASGTALALDQYRGLLAVFVLWISFTIKRLKEEQFMRQQFGAQYIEYAHATGAILPKLRIHN